VGHPDGFLFVPQPGTVGLGYWVLARARRRGLASRAADLLVRWALAAAGLQRVEALVDPDNVASKRVVEKAGFQREGYLRSYLGPDADGRRSDALLYSLVREDRQPGPGPTNRGQAPSEPEPT
jgi:[ribosomal protein S5]-alanine N-acetyltransferase